ncbi:MAG: T9SS type A sorting domain-containing protein [Candidatus Zixiibacteriota bacterium]
MNIAFCLKDRLARHRRFLIPLGLLLLILMPGRLLSQSVDSDGHLLVRWGPPPYGDNLDHYAWSYNINGVNDSVTGTSSSSVTQDNSVTLERPGDWAIFSIRAVSVYNDVSQAATSDTVSFMTVVGVDDPQGSDPELLPEDLRIKIYPNPVSNASMVLSWHVSRSDYYRIDIYDILGRKIKNVRRERMAIGDYNIRLEKDLPSGVYLAVIASDNDRRVVKFSVLR